MKEKLDKLFDGCMVGRTMYIVPFCMGPLGSKYSKIGIEITDSAYVAVSMRHISRIGTEVLHVLGTDDSFLPALHSVGYPLKDRADVPWPCDPANANIAVFADPDKLGVYSYGSGFGANALASKRLFGLRLAAALARKEGPPCPP